MRWLFRIAGVLLATVIVGIIAVFMLPDERIVRLATEQIEARTGREMSVSGDVSLSFWPVLGVRTGPVSIGNADWAEDQPMLSAKGLSIGVSAIDLLSGSVRVTGIIAQEPVLRLQTARDGRANWSFEDTEAAGAQSGAATSAQTEAVAENTPVSLDLLEVRNGTLVYQEAGAEAVVLSGLDIDLRWPDPNGPVKIEAKLRATDDPVNVTAELIDPVAFMEGAVSQVTAQAKVPKGAAAFGGNMNMAGELSGQLEVTSGDLGESLSALGLAPVELPAGWGPAVRLAANVTYTADGRLSLRRLRSEMGENRINGVADVVLGDVPQVTAKLSAGTLIVRQDTAGASSGGGGGAGAAPGMTQEGWSRDPIDASALAAMNGAIRLTAEGIETPDLTVGPVRVRLVIKRSRAVLHLEEVSVFGGHVTGQLVANNRSGFSVGGKLAATDIDILRVQQDMLGMERLRGKAAADLEFLGVGETVDAIVGSLSGKGGLRMGHGVILGLDLDRLMRGDRASGGTTVFDSLGTSFTMRKGDLFNEDLALRLSKYRADGRGRIGLHARDIDYTFTPIALEANSGQGISLPIRIKGPWGAPRIWPDLEAAVKLNAKKELEELEDEAKAKLQEKLAKELDVEVDDGQDVEEVLKDKLEDEAKNQLLKLLGRD